MTRAKRQPNEISLLKEALGKDISSWKQVTEGQDGEKFIIETIDGQKLFCRVKKIREGQELPYQEAAVLESTTSPHIIKPVLVDNIRGNYVIVRPYIEGVPLSDRLKERELRQDEQMSLAHSLIDAVENLQEAGAIHFDIKPENIVCGEDGAYYLIDFGAAKIIKKIRDERIHPARRYIAPEVLDYLFDPTDLGVRRLSVLTDMYGVGGVLYTAITRRRLADFFTSSSDVLQKMPPPVRHLAPEANPELANLVDRLLSKNPSRRLIPRDARLLLNGQTTAENRLPAFFLETKGGRGSEHASMLPVIMTNRETSGIYWKSASAPSFPQKTPIPNVLWEPPLPDSDALLTDSLLAQQASGVIALCIPGHEFNNPVDPTTLGNNTELIQTALKWRDANASHLPLYPVISIEASLLISPEITAIRDAYAALRVDGIIFRICVATYGEQLDVRHLLAIIDFIQPWSHNNHAVLIDGDINLLVLARYGALSFISTTSPRLQTLETREAAAAPDFMQRPDGFYVRTLLGKISPDQTASLRGNAVGRALTNCDCQYCGISLMRRNRAANWNRTERRQHFVEIMPREIRHISRLSDRDFGDQINAARTELQRFRRLVPMSIPHLDTWVDLLSRRPRP